MINQTQVRVYELWIVDEAFLPGKALLKFRLADVSFGSRIFTTLVINVLLSWDFLDLNFIYLNFWWRYL